MTVHFRSDRRSFLRQSTAVMAGLGLMGTTCPWAVAQTNRPRALALHVGLNFISPAHYHSNGQLAGAINDSITMQDIADRSQRFDDIIRLNDNQATIRSVLTHIAWAANILKPGDLFLFTCAGHGTKIPDENKGDEPDGQDEALCLFDGPLLDDVLYGFWGRFAENVKIVMFADTCHSGTVARAEETLALLEKDKIVLPGDSKPEMIRRLRQLSSDDMREAEKAVRTRDPNSVPSARTLTERVSANPSVRALPVGSVSDATVARAFASTYPTRGDKSGAASIGAKGILFAACADDRQALDGNANGLFTSQVRRVLQNSLNFSYRALFNTLVNTGINPQPQFFTFGRTDPAFEGQGLFASG